MFEAAAVVAVDDESASGADEWDVFGHDCLAFVVGAGIGVLARQPGRVQAPVAWLQR